VTNYANGLKLIIEVGIRSALICSKIQVYDVLVDYNN